jgi:hypothetical protein
MTDPTPEPNQDAAPVGPSTAASALETPDTSTARKLDADGRERPRFLLDFPDDPALNELVRAFEVGNYARVRSEATALAERTENAAVRSAALELRRRIEPDPLAKYLLGIAVLLLIFLTVFAYHGHQN